MSSQSSFTLNTGAQIPAVGLGTWQANPGEVKQAVLAAFKAGYRHIDCAACYCNEKEVGEAFHEAFSTGLVKREEVFITSKLWCNKQGQDDVIPGCKQTLADLQLDYLDLYLVHWPIRFRPEVFFPQNNETDIIAVNMKETWPQMEELHKMGLAKAIGISNFSQKKIEDLLTYAKIVPAVNQIELHPFLRQDDLLAFLSSKGIHATAYSPLGSPARPSAKADEVPLLQDPVVLKVAEKLKKNSGQVLIRWGVQHGHSVIPKSTTESRIQSNLQVFDFEIPAEEYKELCNLPQKRLVDGSFFCGGLGPKSPADLWDEEQ